MAIHVGRTNRSAGNFDGLLKPFTHVYHVVFLLLFSLSVNAVSDDRSAASIDSQFIKFRSRVDRNVKLDEVKLVPEWKISTVSGIVSAVTVGGFVLSVFLKEYYYDEAVKATTVEKLKKFGKRADIAYTSMGVLAVAGGYTGSVFCGSLIINIKRARDRK